MCCYTGYELRAALSEESIINCKVIAVHPFHDIYGNEFVCVEFGLEAQKPPNVMSVPQNLPTEISAVMPVIKQIPRLFPQAKQYNNRLVLYLTPNEWEIMQRKYNYGEEVQIKINNKDGTVQLQII
jgi:hypothetical protein